MMISEQPQPLNAPPCSGRLLDCAAWQAVREDWVDFMFNVMGVVFVVHRHDEVTVQLKQQGYGRVTAGDILLPNFVEVLNPDHLVAHLGPGGRLDVRILVERVHGYQPTIPTDRAVV